MKVPTVDEVIRLCEVAEKNILGHGDERLKWVLLRIQDRMGTKQFEMYRSFIIDIVHFVVRISRHTNELKINKTRGIKYMKAFSCV